MIEVIEYVCDDGRCPFAEWFAKLNKKAAARVSFFLERMEAGNLRDHKSVGQGCLNDVSISVLVIVFTLGGTVTR